MKSFVVGYNHSVCYAFIITSSLTLWYRKNILIAGKMYFESLVEISVLGNMDRKSLCMDDFCLYVYDMSVARSSVQTAEPILDPHKGLKYYFETSSEQF